MCRNRPVSHSPRLALRPPPSALSPPLFPSPTPDELRELTGRNT